MRTIDIKTTQNVTIEYELAPLRDRVLAFFIDCLIVGATYMLIFSILLNANEDLLTESSLAIYAFLALVPIGLLISYQLFSEILADGQSWGKKAMGIKVVRLDGQEPGLSDYLLRAIFHIVDTFFSFGIISALLISSSNKSQRLGDMTANTTVIRVKLRQLFPLENILKIDSLEDYEPTYPDVRKFSEKDMLLIKSIIARYRKHPNLAHQKLVNDLVKNLVNQLDLNKIPNDKISFLKVLIRDYIVLTR